MCGVHAHCHDIGGMLDGISPILQNIIKVRRDKRTDLKYSGGSQTLIYAFTIWDFSRQVRVELPNCSTLLVLCV